MIKGGGDNRQAARCRAYIGIFTSGDAKQKTLLRREYNNMAKQRGVNTPVLVPQYIKTGTGPVFYYLLRTFTKFAA